jgi:hypothetical protein
LCQEALHHGEGDLAPILSGVFEAPAADNKLVLEMAVHVAPDIDAEKGGARASARLHVLRAHVCYELLLECRDWQASPLGLRHEKRGPEGVTLCAANEE